MDRGEIIKEIIDSWEKSGEIHGQKILSKKEALKKAEAISYSIKGEDTKQYNYILQERY